MISDRICDPMGGHCLGMTRPVAGREQQIAKLEEEIDRLQRTEEAVVVTTGAPREAGCPPWVLLGVKADKSDQGQTSRGTLKPVLV